MNRDFEVLHDELERALGGLDDQQTQLRPLADSDRWSIQQIVGHLTLTYAATIEAMEASIAKGTPTSVRPTPLQRIGQIAVCRVGYLPGGRKAPSRVTPLSEPARPGGKLIADLTDSLQELDRKATEAEALFGASHRSVRHMVLGPLSIDHWRRFHLVHGRHHIRQIEVIRAEHGV